MSQKHKFAYSANRAGLFAGLLAGLIDLALIVATAPVVQPWLLLQAFLAWTGTGWAAIATLSRMPPLVHAVCVTLFLNIPWVIQFSIGTGTPQHAVPMLVMAVVVGLAFGLVRKRLPAAE